MGRKAPAGMWSVAENLYGPSAAAHCVVKYFNLFFMNGIDMKYFKYLRTAFYMKKRCGSCRDSDLGWGPHMCQILLGVPVRKYMDLGNQFVENI